MEAAITILREYAEEIRSACANSGINWACIDCDGNSADRKVLQPCARERYNQVIAAAEELEKG